MFNSYLSLDAGLYEAIIAAFVVLGLIQSVALARKYNQCQSLKAANVTIAKAAVKAIMSSLTGGLAAIAKVEQARRLAEAQRDEAERALMEMQADIDDANDNARNRDIDPQTLIFGDSHFGVGEHAGRASHFGNVGDRPHDELERLFQLLDGPGRSGSALDELLGSRRFHVVNGGDFIDGPYTSTLDTGRPSLDIAELEAALGAKCIGVSVIGSDGKEIHGAEKDDLLRTFLGVDSGATPGVSRPSFDHDPAAYGTAVHEELERRLGDHGADTLKASLSGDQFHNPQPGDRAAFEPGPEVVDESCSTQQPRTYGASSPRAG